MELECPICGELIELHQFAVQTDCPECQFPLVIDTDADFRNGSWHDLSKLIVNPTFERFNKEEIKKAISHYYKVNKAKEQSKQEPSDPEDHWEGRNLKIEAIEWGGLDKP